MMYMGIASSAKVAGNGAAELEFTLVKVITLKDVSHVRGIRQNLLQRVFLSNHEFKMVFESDEFILFKTDMFVCEVYYVNGTFKFAYIAQSFILWPQSYGRVT